MAEENGDTDRVRRRSSWAVLKVVLGLTIGAGYLYNIAVGGLPSSDAGGLVMCAYYVGTALGLLAAVLLVYSGLRRHSQRRAD